MAVRLIEGVDHAHLSIGFCSIPLTISGALLVSGQYADKSKKYRISNAGSQAPYLKAIKFWYSSYEH